MFIYHMCKASILTPYEQIFSMTVKMHSYFGEMFGKKKNDVGFEVLMAVVMKIYVFWDVTPCSLLKVNRCFQTTCHLHLQSWNAACFMIFCLAYSSTLKMNVTFLQNVGWLLVEYIALYPRRQNSSRTADNCNNIIQTVW